MRVRGQWLFLVRTHGAVFDKPTGAIVGQQPPFGGARAKAGSPLNLLRFVAPRTIKETSVPVSRRAIVERVGFMQFEACTG